MMETVKKSKARFRVGDWVSLLFGPQIVVAKVLEDRGHLGYRGRRLYGIGIDQGLEELTTLETAEVYLGQTTAADVESWQATRSVGIQQPMTYQGPEKDEDGRPTPLHHYLIFAKPGAEVGSGVAYVLDLLSRKPPTPTNGLSQPLIEVSEGGPEAALEKAKEFLDAQHKGLKRIVGDKRP